jgi:hypothetical protein
MEIQTIKEQVAIFGLGDIMQRSKVHFSEYGEWGSTRVNCNRYYTTDVRYTNDIKKVTCKHCLRLLNVA